MKKGDAKFDVSIWICMLRFIAGYMNGVTILNFSKMLAGHTGNITTSILSFVSGDLQGMSAFMLMVGSFFIGAIISGLIFPENKSKKLIHLKNR